MAIAESFDMADSLNGNNSYRRTKDILSDEEIVQDDERPHIEIHLSELPLLVRFIGSKHTDYIIQATPSGGVLMNKLGGNGKK